MLTVSRIEMAGTSPAMTIFNFQEISKRRFKPEMIQAVDRFDLDAPFLVVLEHVERDQRSGGALRIEVAVEFREMTDRLAVDAENQVAALEPGPVGGALIGHIADDQVAARFVGRDPEPWPPGPRGAPVHHQIREDRGPRIGRHEPVAWHS